MPWIDENHKTFQGSSKYPSTSFLSTTPSITLGGSMIVSANPHNREPGKAGLLPGAILWTIPHRPILRMPGCTAKNWDTCRPTFLHAATAKPPSIPTSIQDRWPNRTSTTIWFRPPCVFITSTPSNPRLTPYPSQQLISPLTSS